MPFHQRPKHEAHALLRKAKREANQRKADARLQSLLRTCSEKWMGPYFVTTGLSDPKEGSVGVHCIREHRFHAYRGWKFDAAFPSVKVAVEIDGGQWHITGRDMGPEAERNNEAQIAGWCVLHMTSEMIDEKIMWCAEMVKRAFDMRKKEDRYAAQADL